MNNDVDTLRYSIPEQYLKECSWTIPIEGNTQEALSKTIIENTKRHRECYYIHNSFINYYNSVIKPQLQILDQDVSNDNNR